MQSTAFSIVEKLTFYTILLLGITAIIIAVTWLMASNVIETLIHKLRSKYDTR